MTLKELKDWLDKLPEEHQQSQVVIRDLKSMEEGKFSQKDEPVVSGLLDQQLKRLCFFNIESQKVIELIRESNKQKEEEKKEETPSAE